VAELGDRRRKLSRLRGAIFVMQMLEGEADVIEGE